ncbi:MAG: hypothetical protein JWP76_3956 [Dactylosporangium sp.]|jgi:hypothetical protein|nr:hypothetical protein [Dactylosporangium sp.]
MTALAVLTPSYAPDFELCADLHRSVLAYSPESVEHHLVVPRRDLGLFARLRGPRTHIHCETDFLPRSFVPLPRVNFSVNLRRPFPPVRGWIRQQILKLAAASKLDADVVVLVDSDIEFIRPFTPATFARDESVRFYRQPGGVDERLPRHVIWHRVARQLLGLPPALPPYPDYVSSLLAWDPAVLRQLLTRVEQVTHRPWQTAVGSQLHFSEWTLYGVFVDEVLGAPANAFASTDTRCHSYWEEESLDATTAAGFLGGVKPDDVAVMISAKSRTPLEVRRAALRGLSLAP